MSRKTKEQSADHANVRDRDALSSTSERWFEGWQLRHCNLLAFD